MPEQPSRKGPKPQPPERVRSVRMYLTVTPPEAAKLERIAEREGVPVSTVAYRILSAGLARKR